MKTGWTRLKHDIFPILLTAAGLLILRQLCLWRFHASCILVILTGLPCPACGLTRALILLFTGHPLQSFVMNPAAVPLLVLLAYIFVCHYFRTDGRIPGGRTLLWVIAAAALSSYIVRMILLFPEEMPLTYMHDNLLARSFPAYAEFMRTVYRGLRR